jgi:hypothetical protein
MRVELATASDRRFIRETWLDSMDQLDPSLGAGTFRWGQGRIIDGILAAKETSAFMIGNGAFAVSTRGKTPDSLVLHYVYVPLSERRKGVAREIARMLGSHTFPVVYTHSTILGRAFAESLNAVYNPYLAYEKIAKPKPRKTK